MTTSRKIAWLFVLLGMSVVALLFGPWSNRPKPPPKVSLTLLGYSNGPSGKVIARVRVKNEELSKLHCVLRMQTASLMNRGDFIIVLPENKKLADGTLLTRWVAGMTLDPGKNHEYAINLGTNKEPWRFRAEIARLNLKERLARQFRGLHPKWIPVQEQMVLSDWNKVEAGPAPALP